MLNRLPSLARLFLVVSFSGPLIAHAEPVAVHYLEGSLHGYLSLTSLGGQILASADLDQNIRDGQVTSRLVYRFKDGSIDDETAVFTQNGHFHLISDHHLQTGPSFPQPMEVTVDVNSGEVSVKYMQDGKPKADTSRMDLPDDLSNGILLVLIKNLLPGTFETKVSFLVATPKPRIIHMAISEDGADYFTIAGSRNTAKRFRVHVDLGGISGLVAPLIGKEPPDGFAWISGRQVPTFIKAEYPLYLSGPLLRTELVGPVWKKLPASSPRR